MDDLLVGGSCQLVWVGINWTNWPGLKRLTVCVCERERALFTWLIPNYHVCKLCKDNAIPCRWSNSQTWDMGFQVIIVNKFTWQWEEKQNKTITKQPASQPDYWPIGRTDIIHKHIMLSKSIGYWNNKTKTKHNHQPFLYL